MKQKKIAIAFSGGLDSTYLAYESLKKGHSVSLFRVNIDNNWKKNVVEESASREIISQLEKDFNTRIEYSRLGDIGMNDCNLEMAQPPIWLFFLASSSGNYDEIHLGYILNDCAISYLKEIENAFKAIYVFNKNKNIPKMKFPLIKTHKQQILNDLPKKYKKLTVTCENPRVKFERDTYLKMCSYDFIVDVEYKECGDCDTCEKKKKYCDSDIPLRNTYKQLEKSFEPLIGLEIEEQEHLTLKIEEQECLPETN